MSAIDAESVNMAQCLEVINQLRTSAFASDEEKVQVRGALSAALIRTETPWETASRLMFTEPALLAALKLCHDINLFRRWVDSNDGASMNVEDLACLVGADAELLGKTTLAKNLVSALGIYIEAVRLLRHLQATYVVQQTADGSYSLTEFSKALATDDIGSTIPFSYQTSVPGFLNLPTYLESITYHNPSGFQKTNWHHFRGESRFEDLRQNPSDMATFQAVMRARDKSRPTLLDFFPIEQILKTRRQDKPLFVDVGGGTGQDIDRIRKRMNELNLPIPPQTLILQDLKATSETTHPHACITMMEHDFFKEQPIKGAAMYYCHCVLHDWPDNHAITILEHLANAAEPEYSRILIQDGVMTDRPPVALSAMDLQMLMVYNARERTESEWQSLISKAGLEIMKIWTLPGTVESVIEVVKKRV